MSSLTPLVASSLFRGETITFLPPPIKDTLGEGFNVIGRVMLWRPVEAFFFNPLPLRTSSTAHRFLRSLEIEIRPPSVLAGEAGV